MTITEAMEDIQARIDGEFSVKGIDDCKDLKLGIGALKRHKYLQGIALNPHLHLLPGETEE